MVPTTRALQQPRLYKFILAAVLLAALGGGTLYLLRARSWPHVPTYGAMLHPFGVPVSYQNCGFHTGQDWFAPTGTPIYAVEDGVVAYVGPLWLAGPDVGRGDYSIILFHESEGYYTTYSHNSVAHVTVGERVQKGEIIAEVGSEGYSPSPHLHLEKVVAPFTGDWQEPFVGCEGYVDPGNRWSPF